MLKGIKWKKCRFLHSLISRWSTDLQASAPMNFPGGREVELCVCQQADINPQSITQWNYCLHMCEHIIWHLYSAKSSDILLRGANGLWFERRPCIICDAMFYAFSELSPIIEARWCSDSRKNMISVFRRCSFYSDPVIKTSLTLWDLSPHWGWP